MGQGKREIGRRHRKSPERERGNKKVKKGEFECELWPRGEEEIGDGKLKGKGC